MAFAVADEIAIGDSDRLNCANGAFGSVETEEAAWVARDCFGKKLRSALERNLPVVNCATA